jgi:hypothetical protein
MGSLQYRSTDVSLDHGRVQPELTNSSVSTGNGQPSITLYDSTLDFKVDDEEHMRIIPPTIFVRLRQEMAASRINKLLYSANSHRFAEGAATSYMSLEADRLKEERVHEESSSLDGVDSGMLEVRGSPKFDLLTVTQTSKNCTTTQSRCTSISTPSSVQNFDWNGATTWSPYISPQQDILTASSSFNAKASYLMYHTT